MELIRVNDWQAARLFFDEYDIPYEEITEGENKGQLLVRPARECDRDLKYEAIKRLERSRLYAITDHPNVFRDRNDNAIITFSPYDVDELPKNRPWLEMSEHCIYGYGTKTFVVRGNILAEEKQRKAALKDLDEQIRRAEERVLRAKGELDAAQAALDRELKKLAEMKKGQDSGRVSLKQWDFSWEGAASWDGGAVQMNCSYHAKAAFRTNSKGIRGEEVRKLEREVPGFTRKDAVTALQTSLRKKLDWEFSDYCEEDDYYPPVVEDFDAEGIIQQWAEERNLNVITFEGFGSDDGYEPKRRRW